MKRKRKTLKHALSLLIVATMVFSLMPVMPSQVVQASETSMTGTESTEQTRRISLKVI